MNIDTLDLPIVTAGVAGIHCDKGAGKCIKSVCGCSDSDSLPGLPVSKKTNNSAWAMKEATSRISDSLDEAREALRAPFIKFAEDIKSLEPLFDMMSPEHAKRVLSFLEAATNGMGEALKQEMENAFA